MFRLPLLAWARLRSPLLNIGRPILLRRTAGSFPNTRRYSVDATQAPEELEEIEDFGRYSVILPPEPFVFGVSHIKPRYIPDDIIKPAYVHNNGNEALEGPDKPEGIIELGGEAEMRLRNAAKLAKKVKGFAGSLIKVRYRTLLPIHCSDSPAQVGVTTNAIDKAIHDFILSHKAYPSPLGYLGFPRSCCTSVNNVIVHGIPDEYVLPTFRYKPIYRNAFLSRPLEDGDIVNIDITVYLDGYHGDTSQTFLVGDVVRTHVFVPALDPYSLVASQDQPGRELVDLTNRALRAGIEACGPGRPFRSIGKAISDLLPENYSVSPQFTGHGIGTFFHTRPWILHHSKLVSSCPDHV